VGIRVCACDVYGSVFVHACMDARALLSGFVCVMCCICMCKIFSNFEQMEKCILRIIGGYRENNSLYRPRPNQLFDQVGLPN